MRGWAAAVAALTADNRERAAALKSAVFLAALQLTHERVQAGQADDALLRTAISVAQPDGAERDARVRAALLRRLTPGTRGLVLAEIEGDAALDALSEAELAAIVAGRTP